MNCKQVEKKLSAFQDKTLPASTRLEVKIHLQNCPDCRRKLEELETVWQLLAEAETIDAAPFFWTRLAQRLADRQTAVQKHRQIFHSPRWSPVALLTLVLLAFSVFSGIYFGKTIFQKTAANQSAPVELNESELSAFNSYAEYSGENISEVYVSLLSENVK